MWHHDSDIVTLIFWFIQDSSSSLTWTYESCMHKETQMKGLQLETLQSLERKPYWHITCLEGRTMSLRCTRYRVLSSTDAQWFEVDACTQQFQAACTGDSTKHLTRVSLQSQNRRRQWFNSENARTYWLCKTQRVFFFRNAKSRTQE